MNPIIASLDKAFENRVRLGIMSVLVVNDWVTFNTLKETLGVSDGNLASHLKALEKKEYVLIEKRFVGKKPQTSYKVSEQGQAAFSRHLEALEKLLGK